MLKVNDNLKVDESEFLFTFARSSGPGGQNVNKVNTKAVLRWDLDACKTISDAVKDRFKSKFQNRIQSDGLVVLSSDKYRSQEMNVKNCIDKLKEFLKLVAVAPKKRRETKPTRASKEKRITNKKQRSTTKKNRQKVAY